MMLVVLAFRSDLLRFMAPATYSDATRIIPWIALSQIAWGLYPVLSLGPKITKTTYQLTWIACIAAAVNFALNLLLIPRIGILGAAIATFIGYWILTIITYIVGQRSYAIPLDWVRLGKLAIAGGAMAFLVLQIDRLNNIGWQGYPLKITSLLMFPILLALLGFVSPSQIKLLWNTGEVMIREQLGKIHL